MKALLCPKDEPTPQVRRRRGETGKDGFALAWRRMLRRAAKAGPVARGRYAALRAVPKAREAIAPEPITSADAYEASTVCMATTLEWLMNMWEANSSMEDSGGLDDSFDMQQNHYYPQP